MHLYIATKGIKHKVDLLITELQGKYCPIKYRANKDEPLIDSQIRLSVRPIQLWEIGYPKESHDVVCNTLLGPYEKFKCNGISGNDGEKGVEHSWTKKFVYMFRKLLHLDPIPAWDTTKGMMPVEKESVLIAGLGTKKDYIMENGVEGL